MGLARADTEKLLDKSEQLATKTSEQILKITHVTDFSEKQKLEELFALPVKNILRLTFTQR